MVSSSYSRDRGNVLFLILLAVVLFAALSYAVTNAMRGEGKSASSEQTDNAISQMVQYTSSIEQAINRLRLINNCRDTEISFENPIVSGYTNSSAPSDKRCHVFESAGGGLSYQTPPDGFGGTEYYFTPVCVRGVLPIECSSTGNELTVMIANVPLDMCNAINARMDKGNPMVINEDTTVNISTNKFTGSYASTGDIDMSYWNRKKIPSLEGCRQNNGSGVYYYFKVLIPR